MCRYWAAGVSIPAHIAGALIGLMGGHALLYDVGYPIVCGLHDLACASKHPKAPSRNFWRFLVFCENKSTAVLSWRMRNIFRFCGAGLMNGTSGGAGIYLFTLT